ncbi:hypothetical protein [Nocardioides sp. TF02-7]|uniref:2'-5' RNA ligase family protein n=1 Tax=Nocardioides sp. TF02-7 TaxID=2917724 RepID=UPI001F05DA2A|nr:hypothetical protein [Nocardioides sp. TF02-7]UMG91476.1 hypothetical protein MF408_15250 [Nocardioides sp. TF02-7]
MMLRAAVVPPAEALAELTTATADLRRVPGVDAVPPDQLDIPVASFGNLTTADAGRIVEVLRDAFEGATGPVVRFSGVTLLDPEEQSRSARPRATLVTTLTGDVDPVVDLARFVPEAVARLGLMVDRRRFRPALTLGSVAADDAPRLLATALDGVAGWAGREWTVPGLSLLRMRLDHGRRMVGEEHARIHLA